MAKQYAVPTVRGIMYVNESGGGRKYALQGGTYVNETVSGGGTFFLLFDLAWVVVSLALIGLATNT